MIHILVLANDSLLADMIVSTLSQETGIDVVRTTRRELGKGDRYSVVIIVDEGESKNDSIRLADLLRDGITLLVIKLSLRSRNIFVYESYQLNNPRIERVINLVREFGQANLNKRADGDMNIGALRNALTETAQIWLRK